MLIIKKHDRGFTLVEMMVVISIVSFLSSTALGALNSARIKTNNATRIAIIKEYKNALELAYDANGRYPIVGAGNNNAYCLGDYPPSAGYPNGRCTHGVEEPTIYNDITPYLPQRPTLKNVETISDTPIWDGTAWVRPHYNNDGPMYENQGTGTAVLSYHLEGDVECGFGGTKYISGGATHCFLDLTY